MDKSSDIGGKDHYEKEYHNFLHRTQRIDGIHDRLRRTDSPHRSGSQCGRNDRCRNDRRRNDRCSDDNSCKRDGNNYGGIDSRNNCYGENRGACRRGGSASVKDEGLDEPNEYGFYLVSSTPESGISIAALNGTWKDDDGDYIYFHDGDLYSGSFVVTYADKTIDEGYVQLEYSLNPDDSKEFWYNLYKYDGEFFLGFGASGDIPLDDLYAGQSGDPHYTREESGSGSADDFLGVWACGSITASIDRDPAGEYITVDIHWSASASEGATWTYQCTYDESANVLRCKGLGSRVDYSYSEDGTLTDSSVFDGSDAVFEIKDGALTWSDDKEDMDEELELLR